MRQPRGERSDIRFDGSAATTGSSKVAYCVVGDWACRETGVAKSPQPEGVVVRTSCPKWAGQNFIFSHFATNAMKAI